MSEGGWMRCGFGVVISFLLFACGPLSSDESPSCAGPACGLPPPVVADDDAGGDQDAGSDDDAGGPDVMRCRTDDECDDGKFCNGTSRCERSEGAASGMCRPVSRSPCAPGVICDEESQRCDCHMDSDGVRGWFCGGPDDDADGDGDKAQGRGGGDCDDHDPDRYPGALEFCDYAGHDEDCDLTSVAGKTRESDPLRDRDDDGYIDVRCTNIDPETSEVKRDPNEKPDCDDEVDETHPGAQEDCDGVNNDCDGYVDELPGANESYSARSNYCRDADGDNYSLAGPTNTLRLCGPLPGFIPCRSASETDCDDTDPRVHPDRIEICDGVDNDCDHMIDSADMDLSLLPDQPTFQDTDLACMAGRWRITGCPADRAWCDERTVNRGCETDLTRLSSCRACQTDCHFACGSAGCDEIEHVAVGTTHTCARTREGRVACWGSGANGRLGNGTTKAALIPQAIPDLEGVQVLAAGIGHSCAIAGAERAVYCWGENKDGQLGAPDANEFGAWPMPVAGAGSPRLQAVRAIAVGDRTSCAVQDTGELLCWGLDLYTGMSDRGSVIVRNIQTAAFAFVQNAVDVVVGRQHACMIDTERRVACWGDNTYGQLGDGKAVANSEVVQLVPGLEGVTQLSAGNDHTCALSGKRAYCWGLNGKFQLGRPSDERDSQVAPAPGPTDVVAITAGDEFTCVLRTGGEVSCWGSNDRGQRGDANPAPTAQPTIVIERDASSIDAGAHACATTRDRQVACWGDHFLGQLGDGRPSEDPVPRPVMVRALAGSRN